MVLNNKWGPPTWILFHSISHQISNNNFDNYKITFINIIKKICLNLPCNVASQNSLSFLNKTNPSEFKKIDDIKLMLYIFHNFINKINKKQIYNFSDLEKYKYYDIFSNFKVFLSVYSKQYNFKTFIKQR